MWSIAGLRPAMLHMKACWNPKGGHKPCLCEGVADLRPATPSQKHGLYWLYNMWFFLDETVIGWKCHWMKSFLDESVIGWNRVWMKVSVDEIDFVWKCILPHPRCVRSRLDGTNMSQHEASTRKTAIGSGRLRSRDGRELLFAEALWSTLWTADHVSLMACRVVSVSNELAFEFAGVWPRSACRLEYEKDDVDVRMSVKFRFLNFFGHVSWSCAGCWNQRRVARERATMEKSKNVTESLRLKTRSTLACSRWPWTTRMRVGASCSMNTLVLLCECMTSAKHLATATVIVVLTDFGQTDFGQF